jgi:hypothetical protein
MEADSANGGRGAAPETTGKGEAERRGVSISRENEIPRQPTACARSDLSPLPEPFLLHSLRSLPPVPTRTAAPSPKPSCGPASQLSPDFKETEVFNISLKSQINSIIITIIFSKT